MPRVSLCCYRYLSPENFPPNVPCSPGALEGLGVALGVSARYSPAEPILSHHFLKYGLPLLFLLIAIASLYQYVVFTLLDGFGKYPPIQP